MTCDMYEEQVSALVDNELKEKEMVLLFGHLESCSSCRRSLQMVLDLRSDLGERVPPTAPKELDEKILNSEVRSKLYAGDRKPMALHMWKRRISMPVPIAAAITMALIAGSIALSSLWSTTQTVYITAFPAFEVRANTP